ncbi:hypothetical protein ACFWPQ_46155 [Streptomyces sp. NPDC058464]|uniref:hypothetical protein n=1 Tax=Streptomyces sp. NPDC058464 TaxID=3346511 RepID=UPI003653261B
MASRIRTALLGFHLTLGIPQNFPRGEDDNITDELIDEVLLDGEPVRLIKLQPRT